MLPTKGFSDITSLEEIIKTTTNETLKDLITTNNVTVGVAIETIK